MDRSSQNLERDCKSNKVIKKGRETSPLKTNKMAKNKLQTFRDTFSSGDKVLITDKTHTACDKVGYVMRKTPDFIWVMYEDDKMPNGVWFTGFRFDGIELSEKVNKNRYNLTDKHYDWLKTTPCYEDGKFHYEHLQFNKAFEVNVCLRDIAEKGYYTNKERFGLLYYICNHTGSKMTEFFKF